MLFRFLKIALASILIWNLAIVAIARDSAPSSVEIRREEYLLKQRLRERLSDILKDEYLGMSVIIRYVLIHDPIVSNQSKITRLKLPGFGTQVTITNDPEDIAGYIDKYQRYRTLTVITKRRLPQSIEVSVANMLKENEDLEIGEKDTLSFLVITEEGLEIKAPEVTLQEEEKEGEEEEKTPEEKEKEKVDELVKKIDQDRKEKKERLAKLFPELEQPIEPVDPRQEAESSKHLILSKKAYYNNDLNTALNEVIEAININPYASKSYEMLGSIYYRLKWYNLALNNWEKALALDPENRKLTKFIEKAKREL